MSASSSLTIQQRLLRLESHLRRENPILLDVVKGFRTLDKISYRLGLLDTNESYATQVPWWPMISILGTFSSGKSTFINDFLGYKLQLTGNQAVDDKFTVVCFSNEANHRVLPGLALDADPRFPFYHVSHDIDAVASGEGRRVDSYLQLKTCPSEQLRGKILIDSPGFDADSQRTATLRITNIILDLSDLVLVFFDARHPEPGAMQDTLNHLVTETILRPDSTKFLYILNQIDTTAKEDNPEDVFAAWQRALASKGLTAGRFYRIYNLEAAIHIEDENLRKRFEDKRAIDMQEIMDRIQQVEVERAYRIIGVLEKAAIDIESDFVPKITEARANWRTRVLWLDFLIYGAIFGGILGYGLNHNWWQNGSFNPPWLNWFADKPIWGSIALVSFIAIEFLLIHVGVRTYSSNSMLKKLIKEYPPKDGVASPIVRAFEKNTRWYYPLLRKTPVGWGSSARRRIQRILSDVDWFVQSLNDRFINPSGQGVPAKKSSVATSDVTPPTGTTTNQATEQSVTSAVQAANAPTPTPTPVTPATVAPAEKTNESSPFIRFDISQLDWINDNLKTNQTNTTAKTANPTGSEEKKN